jgi:hypothetical protein
MAPRGVSIATVSAALCALVALVAAAGAAPAPVQPLVSGATPPSRYELPFGVAHVSPSAVVAGAGPQRVRVAIDLDHPVGTREVVAVLYAAPDRDPRHGGAPVAPVPLAAQVTRVGGTVGEQQIALRAVDPPPGTLRLDLVARDSDGARLLARARVPVYAQHRLPPGVSPSGGRALEDRQEPSEGVAAGAIPGTPRALPPGAINTNLTATATGFEAEAYVSMQPNNAGRAIAGVNPGSFNSNPPAFISDAGLAPGTVVTRVLPSASMLEGGAIANLRLCCDPVTAADGDGNLWYGALTLGRQSYVVLNRVAAGTTEFQPVNVAIPKRTTGLQDKPMLTIDNWPSSPKYGRLYVAWVENEGRRQNVVVSECDTRPGGVADPPRCDDPANWTPGASLPAITDASGFYTYPSISAAPNGDVYVAWWNVGRPPSGNEIEIDSCAAGADCRSAASWGPDATVADLNQRGKSGIPFFCPIRPAPGGRVGPQTYVEVGPDGTVYVAYSDLRQNGKRLCTARKRDRTFDSFIAAGPAPNSYPLPNTGVRLSDDSPLARNQHFFPTLAVDRVTGEVQSSLYSTKQDPTQKTTLQYFVGSTDLGATFSPMLPFSTATSNFSGAHSDGFDYGDYEGADAAQGIFLPVWTDNRKGIGGKRRKPDVFALTPP